MKFATNSPPRPLASWCLPYVRVHVGAHYVMHRRVHVARAYYSQHLRRFSNHLRRSSGLLKSKDADIGSHLSVLEDFLTELWGDKSVDETRKRAATGVLLERIVRYQPAQGSLVLAYIRADVEVDLRDYIREWIRGHFLSEESVAAQERRVHAYKAAAAMRILQGRRRRIALVSFWPRGL